MILVRRPSSNKPASTIAAIISLSALALFFALRSTSSAAVAPETSLDHFHSAFPENTSTPTPPGCPSAWNVFASPNIGTGSNHFSAVDALSNQDIWVAGSYQQSGSWRTLVQHWNGSQWVTHLPPNPSPNGNSLSGVVAIAPNDVWAVGQAGTGQPGAQTLVVHWNGTDWSQVPSPSPGSFANSLFAVAAVGANDIWAVGNYTMGSGLPDRTLILHWDGTSWTHVPSPDAGSTNWLYGVTAISSNDVWAVGWYASTGPTGNLALHWDGSTWSITPIPNQGNENNFLYAALALSSNDIWVVGGYSVNQSVRSLTMHWDGSAWTHVQSPNPTGREHILRAVAATGPNDVWAVGNYIDGGGGTRTLALHWDGTAWATTATPSPGQSGNDLRGIVAFASNDVWTVGYTSAGATQSTLVLRYAVSCPTLTPTPTATPCHPGWTQATTTDPGILNRLYGIDALSTTDAWAVGYYLDANNQNRSLTQRWDGSTWVPVPNPGTGTLRGVSALASNDVWAVGHLTGTYTMHWDGAAWTVLPSPNPGMNSQLHSVAAVSPTDAWAVGYHDSGPILLRWNGSTWNQVPAPTGFGSALFGITAINANDIWAVGSSSNQALTIRWNGATWNIVNTPPLFESHLRSIDAVSATDIWAVGTYGSGEQTLILHWNGSSWTQVLSPNGGNLSNQWYGVTAVTASHAYAVGQASSGGGGFTGAMIGHWNGSAWTILPTAIPGGQTSSLHAVDALSTADAWAAGTYVDTGTQRSLIMRQTTPPCAPPTHTPTATGTATATSTPTATPTPCGPAWRVVNSPNVDSSVHVLTDLAVISANDIWAVGYYGAQWRQGLALHWDGAQWAIATIPHPGTTQALLGVAAISANDAWAVGSTFDSSNGQYRPFVIHWDGTQWAEVSAPIPTPGAPVGLADIVALSTNDVWAVGRSGFSDRYTLIMHWDGTAWTQLPSPSPASYANALESISALAPNDIWAVGYMAESGQLNSNRALIVHWDGVTWSLVQAADPGAGGDTLSDVDALAANDVWAVGRALGQGGRMVQHWDGSQWSLAMSGLPNSLTLTGVEAISPTDVWAVGHWNIGSPIQTFAAHWNGTTWSEVFTPSRGNGWSRLFGIAMVAPTDIWAVGNGGDNGTLVERYYNWACFTGTPVPTTPPIWTPTITPTRTATSIPTAIGSPTAAPCSIQFDDVPPSHTFYTFVRCLACRGVLSGYADGTFRPENDITRGQIAKVISNAAGFEEDPGPQTYEDVPLGSTFYAWINRLGHRGHIGGYPCGGPGEPCGAQNLPYFRPGANATRGQIAKIVSNAAGFNNIPASQSFEDVSPSNPFYLWIERLASRGIMSGYPCGGPGEPCGPLSLPYFRWQNNATRGQTSKIVANTFFPDCQTP